MKILSYFNQRLQQVTSTQLQGGRKGSQVSCACLKRLPGVPEGGPGPRGPPAHYGVNDEEVAVVLPVKPHVCDQPIPQAFLLKTCTF